MKAISGKPLAWILTVVYFASYVTRINFAAIVQEIVSDLGYEKTAMSVILVVISITYGVGQLINGWLGDKIKPDLMILAGLSVATLMNLLFPVCRGSILLLAILWGINGFAQAMMWPPMVKILVSASDSDTYNYSVIRIYWGSSFGTILVYLVSPLIISLVGWEFVFVFCAIIGGSAIVLWQTVRSRINTEAVIDDESSNEEEDPTGQRFPASAAFPIALISVAIIMQGMLRDGISSWMPTYLSEVFSLDNETSILLTVSLAIFSIAIISFTGTIYKKHFENEVVLGGVLFAVATVSSLLLYLLFNNGVALAVVLMMLINGCMHGINLMLITHVPKRFKKYGNISTISGAINSCTYIGAAISTYLIALLSEVIGWHGTIAVWGAIAFVGVACCFAAAMRWKKFYNE